MGGNPSMSEQSIEATGRTLDEAKRAAADALGVSIDQLEFEVIEQGAKGLFAKNNYKVKATVVDKPKVTKKRTTKAEEKVESETPSEVAAVHVETDDESEAEDINIEATESDAEHCQDLIKGLFDACQLNINVEVESISGKYVHLGLSGEDVGMLLQSKQPVIDSVQYLGNAMLTRVLPGGVRLTLDARKYREQRQAALEAEARAIAEEVVKIQQEAVFDALPAHERRVIHQALIDFEGVETYSEGEEPNRRVVISPKTD